MCVGGTNKIRVVHVETLMNGLMQAHKCTYTTSSTLIEIFISRHVSSIRERYGMRKLRAERARNAMT